ncbi:DUF2635 domain-containing protein [Collimonas pratensis]|uniref:DUF2635 domain-containing protein n=1 Tax=Collimonas pratensis TaxID=279113 RepID=A0ABM5Z3T8_9BURK|nr:DUF2635 domain-containing protein [Collimonas pratensis]AMP13676.1 hypothetical protein CPter291_1402 [Collimonas pratensis]
MSELKRITPKAGLIVPLPDGNGNLPAEGKNLRLNSYWYQRKFDGDVTIDDVPVEGQAPSKESPANRDTEVKPAGK